MLFTQDFDQSTRVAAGNISIVGHVQNTHGSVALALPNSYLISDFNGMPGLCAPAIEQNNARVAKLLGYGAARAEAAQLQE